MIVLKEQLVHRSDAAKFSPVSRQEKAPICPLVIPLVLMIDLGQHFGPQNNSVVRSLEAVVVLASKHLQLCHLVCGCDLQVQVSWKLSCLLVPAFPLPVSYRVQALAPSGHQIHAWPHPSGLRALAFQGIFLPVSLFSCLYLGGWWTAYLHFLLLLPVSIFSLAFRLPEVLVGRTSLSLIYFCRTQSLHGVTQPSVRHSCYYFCVFPPAASFLSLLGHAVWVLLLVGNNLSCHPSPHQCEMHVHQSSAFPECYLQA